MGSSTIAFASPFHSLCTTKLSHIAPNVSLKCQKTHLPFHKINSSRFTLILSSLRSKSGAYFERSQIHAKTSSLSSSSKDDYNNSGTSSNNKNDNHNDVEHMHKSVDNQELYDVSNDDEFGIISYLLGKQQVTHGFLKYLMTRVGDHIEFVVKPTLRHGINLGFTWRFQWSKTHFPLGEGFNLYILQTYQGRFFIRNLEMLVEVLPLRIEPIRLRFVAFMIGILNVMEGLNLSRDNMKRAMVALVLMVIVLLFLSPEVY